MLELIKLANDRNIDIKIITQSKRDSVKIIATKQGWNNVHNESFEIGIEDLDETAVRTIIYKIIDSVEGSAANDKKENYTKSRY